MSRPVVAIRAAGNAVRNARQKSGQNSTKEKGKINQSSDHCHDVCTTEDRIAKCATSYWRVHSLEEYRDDGRTRAPSIKPSLAESKRAKLRGEYADQIEHKKEAAKRKGGDRKSVAAKSRKISDGKNSVTDRDSRTVASQRAKSAGTNPRYISDADKIA